MHYISWICNLLKSELISFVLFPVVEFTCLAMGTLEILYFSSS